MSSLFDWGFDMAFTQRSVVLTSSIALALSLTACGGGSDGSPTPTPTPTDSSVCFPTIMQAGKSYEISIADSYMDSGITFPGVSKRTYTYSNSTFNEVPVLAEEIKQPYGNDNIITNYYTFDIANGVVHNIGQLRVYAHERNLCGNPEDPITCPFNGHSVKCTYSPIFEYRFNLTPDSTYSQSYTETCTSSRYSSWDTSFKAFKYIFLGFEKVTVRAGTFDTCKYEAQYAGDVVKETLWFSQSGQSIPQGTKIRVDRGLVNEYELVSITAK